MNRLLLALLFTSTIAHAEYDWDARESRDNLRRLNEGLMEDRKERFNQTMDNLDRIQENSMRPKNPEPIPLWQENSYDYSAPPRGSKR